MPRAGSPKVQKVQKVPLCAFCHFSRFWAGLRIRLLLEASWLATYPRRAVGTSSGSPREAPDRLPRRLPRLPRQASQASQEASRASQDGLPALYILCTTRGDADSTTNRLERRLRLSACQTGLPWLPWLPASWRLRHAARASPSWLYGRFATLIGDIFGSEKRRKRQKVEKVTIPGRLGPGLGEGWNKVTSRVRKTA